MDIEFSFNEPAAMGGDRGGRGGGRGRGGRGGRDRNRGERQGGERGDRGERRGGGFGKVNKTFEPFTLGFLISVFCTAIYLDAKSTYFSILAQLNH